MWHVTCVLVDAEVERTRHCLSCWACVPTNTEGLTAVKHAAADLPLATLTLVTLGHLAMNLQKNIYWCCEWDVHLLQILAVGSPGLTLQNSTFCPHNVFVFCVDLRTNSDYFPMQHYLNGLYNREGMCLLRGTDWVFIYNSDLCEINSRLTYGRKVECQLKHRHTNISV